MRVLRYTWTLSFFGCLSVCRKVPECIRKNLLKYPKFWRAFLCTLYTRTGLLRTFRKPHRILRSPFRGLCVSRVSRSALRKFEEGPDLENIQDLSRRLKFSSEIETVEIFKRIEHFKPATHQTPIHVGEFSWSRLKLSSEIEVFKRDS